MPDLKGPRRKVGRPKIDEPDPVDVHVGSRVRLRRKLLGMSQERLGESIGLTFQQVQKYERGANRIGVSRLHQLGRVLEVPVSFFFDDAPESVDIDVPHAEGADQSGPPSDQDIAEQSSEFIRSFYRIKSTEVRDRLYALVMKMASIQTPERRRKNRSRPRNKTG